MQEADLIANVRRGLLRKGFGRSYANRVARELEEHRSDLVEEGLRQGLSGPDAEARAIEGLGSAESLVREFSSRMQSSSWLGRHQTVGFVILAILGTLLWWATFVVTIGWSSGVFWVERKSELPAPPLDFLIVSVDWVRSTSYVVIPWLICWVARRMHCGWKASLWGCLVVAIHNASHVFVIAGGQNTSTMTWSYSFNTSRGPDWLPILAPLAVFALDMAWNLRPKHSSQDATQNHSDLPVTDP